MLGLEGWHSGGRSVDSGFVSIVDDKMVEDVEERPIGGD